MPYDGYPEETTVRPDARIELVRKFIDVTDAHEDARRRREQASDEVEKLSQVLFDMRRDLSVAFGLGEATEATEAITNEAPKRAYY